MKHYLIWLAWYRRNVDASIDEMWARRIYDEYYSCNCRSCEYRKSYGLQPIQTGETGCLAPISPLDRDTLGKIFSTV